MSNEANSLSTTDASNTARFPEGQAASSLNDGARALEGMMARKFKDEDGSIVSTGSSNAYALALNTTLSAPYDGMTLTFQSNFANTGAATLTPTPSGGSAFTARAIVWPDGTALASGDIPSGAKVTVRYESGNTRWQLISATKPPYADPMTTRGDLLVRNSSNVTARLAIGTASQVLTSDGTDVAWATATGGDDAIYSALLADLWNRRKNDDTETGSLQGKVDAYKADSIGTASTSETYDSSADYYHNNGGSGTDRAVGITPTSNRSTSSGSLAQLTDGNTATNWQASGTSSANDYIQIDLAASYSLGQMKVYTNTSNDMWASVVVKGSTTGAWAGEEITLGTATLTNTTGYQTITLSGTARYVRLISVDGSMTATALANDPLLYELQITDVTAAANMVLLDQAITLNTAATAGHVLVLVDPVDSVTLNTDFVTALTCDGGSNFTNVTLAKKGTLGNYEVYVGKATGMTSGSTGGYRHTVANNKELRVAGTAVRMAG